MEMAKTDSGRDKAELRDIMTAFFVARGHEIEVAFWEALDDCCGSNLRAVNNVPVLLGISMLREAGIDTEVLRLDDDGNAADSSKPDNRDTLIQGVLSSILETKRKRQAAVDAGIASGVTTPNRGSLASGAATPPSEGPATIDLFMRTTEQFLQAAKLGELVKDALIKPLKEAVRLEKSELELNDDLEREFILALGDHHNERPVMEWFEDFNLQNQIAVKIHEEAKKLKQQTIGTAEGDYASKYFEDGDSSLQYGDLDAFDGGLDAFLGPPNPNLRDTVQREHCNEEDSQLEFRAPNYRTTTRPDIEFWFVANPSVESMSKCHISSWPRESYLPKNAKARTATHLEDFDVEMDEVNSKLRDQNVDPLQLVELLCARLYTGPM